VTHVSGRLLGALVGGRVVYRLAVLASTLLLVDAWGSSGFAAYAGAMGAFAFVLPVVASGVEKSALKLLPRTSAARPSLVGGFLAAGVGLAFLFLAVLGAAALAGWGVGSLRLAVGALAALLAVNQLLVGLQRALGRPRRDLANSLALAAATLGAAVAAVAVGAGALTYVCALAALVGCLDAVLLASLGPWSLRRLRRRSLLVHAARTTALMGVADVAGGLATAALFVVLSRSALAGQASPLFVTTSAAALLFGLVEFVLRVLQPQVSLALGRRPASARRHARRLGASIVLGGSAYLALAVAGAVALVDVTSPPAGLPDWAPALALLVALLPVFLATAILNYVLENLDTASLRLTAVGSAAGLAGAVGAGLVLAPRWGAFGAVAALAVGEIVHAAAVTARYQRGRAVQRAGRGRDERRPRQHVDERRPLLSELREGEPGRRRAAVHASPVEVPFAARAAARADVPEV
jgi:hypothetical protein